MTTEDPIPPKDDGASETNAQYRREEPVWTYRGYALKPGDFTSAMVHLFRGEIARANVWRQRLDATTNWAVLTTATSISFAVSEPAGHHSVLLLNTLLVTLFLWIEARRYRYYELWSARVRLMETDFFATMLVPPFHPSADWAETLADSLLHPHFPISLWEAFGRRLRRNYIWIYVILAASWALKLWLHPSPAGDLATMITRAAIGPLSGWLVASAAAAFFGLLFAVALLTVGLHEAAGEVLPRFGEDLTEPIHTIPQSGERPAADRRAWFRPSRRRHQFLVMIITDHPDTVAQTILKYMRRGVTALQGTGMYTHQPHTVLMSAMTVTEVPQLKALVRETDPQAFVIVTPVHEVLGLGFVPLET